MDPGDSKTVLISSLFLAIWLQKIWNAQLKIILHSIFGGNQQASWNAILAIAIAKNSENHMV